MNEAVSPWFPVARIVTRISRTFSALVNLGVRDRAAHRVPRA
jgi:hypothetical protein